MDRADDNRWHHWLPSRGGRASALTAALLVAALACSAAAQKVSRKKPEDPSATIKPAVVREAPRVGSVVVATGVSGAEVRLESAATGGRRMKARVAHASSDGTATFADLAPGMYAVRATAPEHTPFEGEARVDVGRPTSVRADLVPVYGWLMLGGEDLAIAETLTLDGHRLEPATLEHSAGGVRLRADPGKHQILVEARGRVPFAAAGDVSAGVETTIAVRLEASPGELVVEAPAGATLYVDGNVLGTVPSTGEIAARVEPDVEHAVRLERDGFQPFEAQAKAAPGGTTRVTAAMVRRVTSGPFGETFGGSLGHWTAPGDWQVDPSVGKVRISGTEIGLADVYYEDLEMYFGLRMIEGRGAAWILRAGDTRTGYLFVLTVADKPRPSQLAVYYLENGRYDADRPAYGPVTLDPEFKPGFDYRVEVRATGNTFRAWLTSSEDGRKVSVCNFVDPGSRFQGGSVGFAGVGGTFEAWAPLEVHSVNAVSKP